MGKDPGGRVCRSRRKTQAGGSAVESHFWREGGEQGHLLASLTTTSQHTPATLPPKARESLSSISPPRRNIPHEPSLSIPIPSYFESSSSVSLPSSADRAVYCIAYSLPPLHLLPTRGLPHKCSIFPLRSLHSTFPLRGLHAAQFSSLCTALRGPNSFCYTGHTHNSTPFHAATSCCVLPATPARPRSRPQHAIAIM